MTENANRPYLELSWSYDAAFKASDSLSGKFVGGLFAIQFKTLLLEVLVFGLIWERRA